MSETETLHGWSSQVLVIRASLTDGIQVCIYSDHRWGGFNLLHYQWLVWGKNDMWLTVVVEHTHNILHCKLCRKIVDIWNCVIKRYAYNTLWSFVLSNHTTRLAHRGWTQAIMLLNINDSGRVTVESAGEHYSSSPTSAPDYCHCCGFTASPPPNRGYVCTALLSPAKRPQSSKHETRGWFCTVSAPRKQKQNQRLPDQRQVAGSNWFHELMDNRYDTSSFKVSCCMF